MAEQIRASTTKSDSHSLIPRPHTVARTDLHSRRSLTYTRAQKRRNVKSVEVAYTHVAGLAAVHVTRVHWHVKAGVTVLSLSWWVLCRLSGRASWEGGSPGGPALPQNLPLCSMGAVLVYVFDTTRILSNRLFLDNYPTQESLDWGNKTRRNRTPYCPTSFPSNSFVLRKWGGWRHLETGLLCDQTGMYSCQCKMFLDPSVFLIWTDSTAPSAYRWWTSVTFPCDGFAFALFLPFRRTASWHSALRPL